MKILCIHADFIEFEAKKKAFKGAEEGVTKERKRIDECLVIFSAVEQRDEADIPGVLQRYLQEIKNIAQQVNVKNIVLYPYAHLSSSLANPAVAEKFLKEAETKLADKYAVARAPFGWYKAFDIKCKGHPLSELSREFGPASDKEKGDLQESEEKQENQEKNLAREFKDEAFELDDRELNNDEKIKLTAAYLLASILKEKNPDMQVGSAGFYHDQAYIDVSVKVNQDMFKSLQKELKHRELNLQKADQLDELQKSIARDLGEEAQPHSINGLSVVPLYANPFVAQPIAACRILNVASAYWKNNQNNKQLTRIYLVAFDSPEKLEMYLQQQEEAEARSHLRIGKEQGLFVVSDLVGPGLPLLAPRGMILKNELVKFLWELHQHKGYQQVGIPHIAKDSLYKTSGHWDKFGDELFHVKGKHENFVLKPMNCPHHIQIFNAFSYSYRDMPIRFFEPTTVYRDEKPGQLLGLSRVRAITQDDGHIFCRISQIKQEVKTIVQVIIKFYQTIGMDKDYWVSLSVRGDDTSKYLGDDKIWQIAESSLEEVAEENKLPFRKIKGEAAFYGPKLDFMFKDALGREWQLATIQLDFNLPQRFDLGFMNEESKKEQPVMIHRAVSGSLERFMSVLIEHFAGKFPVWLNPVQVKLLTITDRNIAFVEEVQQKMQQAGLRVEVDTRVESMGKKVHDAQLEKPNYIVTVGDKEQEKGTLAVRERGSDQTKFDVPVAEFIEQVANEIKERRL